MAHPKTELVRRLVAYRERRHMSQNALADYVGVDRKTMSNIINGKHEPHADTLRAIADGLGWETGDVFKWSAELLHMDHQSSEDIAQARRDHLNRQTSDDQSAALRRAQRKRRR